LVYFEIYSPDIDESILEGELVEYVARLHKPKAQAVLGKFPDAM
jgi:septum formation protein